jgi:hypothetical protein
LNGVAECGAGSEVDAFADAIVTNSVAYGTAVQSPLVDDTGQVLDAVLGACAVADCEPRTVLAGTPIGLFANFSALAAQRGVELDGALSLASTDPQVIQIETTAPLQHPCDGQWELRTNVRFERAGKAAIVPKVGAAELARFTFEVEDDAVFSFEAMPDMSSQNSVRLELADTGAQVVRGAPGAVVEVRLRAVDAAGREMIIGAGALDMIDDPMVAAFVWGTTTASSKGTRVSVRFLQEGQTMLQAELAGRKTTVTVLVDPSLPAPVVASGNAGASAGASR